MEVLVSRAPAAAQLDMLSVDLPMRVNLDRAVVGVMPTHDHTPAITNQIERLAHRIRIAARLDHYIEPAAACKGMPEVETLEARARYIYSIGRTHLPREREAIRHCIHRDQFPRAAQRSESDDTLPDRSRAHHCD